MTAFATYKETTGRVLSVGTAPDEATGLLQAREGVKVYLGGVLANEQYIDPNTEQPVSYTELEKTAFLNSPGQSYEWLPLLGEWVDLREAAIALAEEKELLLVKIHAERERRNLLPITFSGSSFDADEKGQRNLTAWMVNIAAGITVPAGFVWRDYDNVDHPADAAFIVGLGGAVTLRGTHLYQTAWEKKAEVSALTTLEAVMGYDPTAGW